MAEQSGLVPSNVVRPLQHNLDGGGAANSCLRDTLERIRLRLSRVWRRWIQKLGTYIQKIVRQRHRPGPREEPLSQDESGLVIHAPSVPGDSSWKQRRTIPQEVTDLIIACVGLWDNRYGVRRRTLLACALVCSSWLLASRRQLFRRVRFSRDNASLERFLQTLHSQFMQHHLSYVSAIHFYSPGRVASHQSYMHRLVGHIPSLETLRVRSCNWSDPSYHPSTFTLFSGFPVLHTLKLKFCTFPSFATLRHMLSAVSRLAALTLWVVHWPPPERLNLPYRAIPGHRPALASLEVHLKPERQAEILQWLCSTSTIHSIKCIGFAGATSGEDGRDNFLRMSAPSIRELCCEARDIKMLVQHISGMINLEKLSVTVTSLDVQFGALCRDLSRTLQHFSGQHLQHIWLQSPMAGHMDKWTEELSGLGGEVESDDPAAEEGHPGADFKFLEQILTRENMAEIAVVFLAHTTEREQGDRFRLALQSKFPKLYKHCVFEYQL